MKSILGIGVALALTACATSNPNVVPVYGAQRMSNVYDATVLAVRPVTIDGSQSGLGAGAGAIAGGIAGSNVGGGNGAVVGSLIGAVIGGVAGNAMERGATQQNGVEIIVQLRNGQRRAIVQGATPDVLSPGDPVILISFACAGTTWMTVSSGYIATRTKVVRAPVGPAIECLKRSDGI